MTAARALGRRPADRLDGQVATHNGTIVNADGLFQDYGLERAGEVDSEILCRMAGAAMGRDGIDPDAFLRLVASCQGQISAVLAAEAAPGRVLVLKGKWRSHMNMPLRGPLEFRYSRKHRAVTYASDGRVLDDAIEAGGGSGHDRRPMVVRPMTMLVFRREEVFRPEAYRLAFAAA